MMNRKHPWWLMLMLAGYCAIGTLYILGNPLWEAPDEIHHFPMVQYLQTHGLQLPSQEAGTVGLWQQEGNQPPLYYLLGALLISPIDTSNIDTVMRVNPHADIGIMRPDGNVNRIVHHPTERFPGSGAVLATYMLRFFSLLLGAGTVYITYCIGREVFPEQPLLALAAAGLNTFLPMFLYISASVNNDNLSNLLANGLVLLLIRLVQANNAPSLRTYIIIGLVTAAGLLAKLHIGLLIPGVAAALLIISMRLRDWRPIIIGSLICGTLTIAIAGWWYWRNWSLYGDPTALNRFLDIIGRRPLPATLAQLWTERDSFLFTFWGFFGSVNVPMQPALYPVFQWLTLFVGISLCLYLASQLWNRKGHHPNMLALVIAIVWPAMTFVALLRWTSITPASQGRLLFGAISPLMLWFAVGLLWWIPEKWRGWAAGVSVTLLAIIAALQPWLAIAPTYAPPAPIEITRQQAVFSADGGRIAVGDMSIQTTPVYPGEYIEITVDFEALTTFDRDWSLFVHLVTADGIIIGQRDIYPGGGLLATSDMQAGYAWHNPTAIFVPQTTYAPTSAEVRLGWYHLPTGRRMTLAEGSETLTIGQVEIVSQESEIPNPQHINFGNQIALIGYNISTMTPTPGEMIELTLYWQALQPIERDYVVFAHIIDPRTLTKYADSNAMPVQWTRPTSTWALGEMIEDTHSLTIAPDAVPGVYPIEIGLYLQQDGFPRLGVLGTYDTSVYLTPVRIASEASP